MGDDPSNKKLKIGCDGDEHHTKDDVNRIHAVLRMTTNRRLVDQTKGEHDATLSTLTKGSNCISYSIVHVGYWSQCELQIWMALPFTPVTLIGSQSVAFLATTPSFSKSPEGIPAESNNHTMGILLQYRLIPKVTQSSFHHPKAQLALVPPPPLYGFST